MAVDIVGKVRDFRKSLYNKEEKSVLGRDCRSWGMLSLSVIIPKGFILLFFACFYGILAGVFAALLTIFNVLCITEKMPYLSGDHSLLRNSPGLSIAMTQKESVSFYHFFANDTNKSSGIIDKQKKLLGSYTKTTLTFACNETYNDFPNRPCEFNITALGPCADPVEALKNGMPCIYLKINKVYGWLPKIKNDTLSNTGLVTCNGKNQMDTVFLGKPHYHPEVVVNNESYASVSNLQFPYLNQRGYQSPLVAVQFPEITKNTLVMVKCMVHNLENSMGEVSFDISVDT